MTVVLNFPIMSSTKKGWLHLFHSDLQHVTIIKQSTEDGDKYSDSNVIQKETN